MEKQKKFKLMKIEDNKNFNSNELKNKNNFPIKIKIPRINYSNLSENKSPSKKKVKKGFFDRINSPKIISKKIIEPFYEINKIANSSFTKNTNYITSPCCKFNKTKNKLPEVNKFCLNTTKNNKNNSIINHKQYADQTIKINLIKRSPRKLLINNNIQNINNSATIKTSKNYMFKSRTNENLKKNNITENSKIIRNIKFNCLNSNISNKESHEKKCIENLKQLITPSKYRLRKNYDDDCQEIHINIFQKINFKNNIVNNNEINHSFRSLSYSNCKRHKYYNRFHITEYKNNQRFRMNNNFKMNNNSEININSKKIFKIKKNELLTKSKKITSKQKEKEKEKRKIKIKNKSQNIFVSKKKGIKTEKSFGINLSYKNIINKNRNKHKNNKKRNMTKHSNFVVVIDEKNDTENKDKEKEFKKSDIDLIDNVFINSMETLSINDEPRQKIGCNLVTLKLFNDFNNKLKIILDKLYNYETCIDECFDWISSFFNYSFYKKEASLFLNQLNKKNIYYYIKIEILCYFLCYDISFNDNFKQASILLKTIFNLIHKNLLILFLFAINLKNDQIIFSEDDNEFNINEIKNLIESELRMNFTAQDMNEYTIINLISNNFKGINNYYKIIIDNLYSINYSEDIGNINNNFRFPGCLNININELNEAEKLKIISIFFFDAYKLITNYNFKELQMFFDLYLYKLNNNQSLNNTQKNIKNLICLDTDHFFLPRIKNNLKYTLVLDLNKILVLNNNNKIILRNGLYEFLDKMKKNFELVIFSFDEIEFIKNAISMIEQKEKYFDYILSKNKAIEARDGNLIKDLSLLGRDIKKVIIIESSNNVNKIHKDNQIIITENDNDFNNNDNVLKLLGDLLENIVKESNINGDVRISLQTYKKNCNLFRDDL